MPGFIFVLQMFRARISTYNSCECTLLSKFYLILLPRVLCVCILTWKQSLPCEHFCSCIARQLTLPSKQSKVLHFGTLSTEQNKSCLVPVSAWSTCVFWDLHFISTYCCHKGLLQKQGLHDEYKKEKFFMQCQISGSQNAKKFNRQ